MAEIITGGRKTGKTTTLIQRCAEAAERLEVVYIVCHSREEAGRIAVKAAEMGLDIRFPLTYEEFLRREHAGRNIGGFYFDNIDRFVEYVSGPVPIQVMTVNIDSEVHEND